MPLPGDADPERARDLPMVGGRAVVGGRNVVGGRSVVGGRNVVGGRPMVGGRPVVGAAVGRARVGGVGAGAGPLVRGGRLAGRGRSAPARRRLLVGALAVFLTLAGIFITGAGLGQLTSVVPLPSWLRSEGTPPPRDFPVMEPSRPTRIAIPAIGVDAPIHDVGLAKDGTIEVPPVNEKNQTGWYDESPTPGQFGPSIVVGHVDTKTGPAVFSRLGDVEPGTRIEVTREDRSVAVFEVNTVESFDKTALPADRIFGDFTRPGLRLITCGGRWIGGETGYADNVVVFASLIEAA